MSKQSYDGGLLWGRNEDNQGLSPAVDVLIGPSGWASALTRVKCFRECCVKVTISSKPSFFVRKLALGTT